MREVLIAKLDHWEFLGTGCLSALKKLEQVIERLSDGNVNNKIVIGGSKQFKNIEHWKSYY